jgi:hypothetical protein
MHPENLTPIEQNLKQNKAMLHFSRNTGPESEQQVWSVNQLSRRGNAKPSRNCVKSFDETADLDF